jgi:hypothetical protein
MAALEPSAGLLSALTSLPAALYYARALGAAAVHPLRDGKGRITRLRTNAACARTLLVFLAGSVLVAASVNVIRMAFGPVASEHAALGAVVVAVLWPHAGEKAVRALLVLLLIALGASRVLLGGELWAGTVAGCALGLCCAWAAQRCVRRGAPG